MNKAIFLDRDGTINYEKGYLYKIEDFEIIPGVLDALRLLQLANYKLIIITNQSGIARGYYDIADFKKLNNWMVETLKKEGVFIDDVYYCPHHPDAVIEKYRKKCNCRKPKTGLFRRAITDYNLDIDLCFAIGDKLRDCSICTNTGCKGFLISNNEEKKIIEEVKKGLIENVQYAENLLEATKQILKI